MAWLRFPGPKRPPLPAVLPKTAFRRFGGEVKGLTVGCIQYSLKSVLEARLRERLQRGPSPLDPQRSEQGRKPLSTQVYQGAPRGQALSSRTPCGRL